MRKKRSLATLCPHKDKPLAGKGLCSKCYSMKKRRDAGSLPRARRTPWKCGHTERICIKGYCDRCYAKLKYRNSHPDCVPRELSKLERFSKFVIIEQNGCWSWTGCRKKNPDGTPSYPMFHPGGEASPMHAVRWAWIYIRKLDAPARGSGLELSHVCKGPQGPGSSARCANPYHCVLESRKQNMARVPKAVRQRVCANARAHWKGRKRPHKTHCKQGHLLSPDNKIVKRGNRCLICHRQYGREYQNTVRARKREQNG